jgi:hypothetical protein
MGRFRSEWSGVKGCSKKADGNLLIHGRPHPLARSRMATLKRGDGKTRTMPVNDALVSFQIGLVPFGAEAASTEGVRCCSYLPPRCPIAEGSVLVLFSRNVPLPDSLFRIIGFGSDRRRRWLRDR